MATRAERFYGPAQLGNSADATLATVPVDERWLIRNVTLLNLSATVAATVHVGIGSTATANRVLRLDVPVSSQHRDEGWWVIEAGEDLVARVAAAGQAVTLAFYGYRLRV